MPGPMGSKGPQGMPGRRSNIPGKQGEQGSIGLPGQQGNVNNKLFFLLVSSFLTLYYIC